MADSPKTITVECDTFDVTPSRGRLLLTLRGVLSFPGLPTAVNYLTCNDICERLQIPLRTLEKQRKQAHPIPVTYVGKSPRFLEWEVRAWAEDGRSVAARRALKRLLEVPKPKPPMALLFSGSGYRRKRP